MVVAPQLDHRQTFIILHGRGSNAGNYAPLLLAQIECEEPHFMQSYVSRGEPQFGGMVSPGACWHGSRWLTQRVTLPLPSFPEDLVNQRFSFPDLTNFSHQHCWERSVMLVCSLSIEQVKLVGHALVDVDLYRGVTLQMMSGSNIVMAHSDPFTFLKEQIAVKISDSQSPTN
jgi:hypothetical protein